MFRVPPSLSRTDQDKLGEITRLIDGATSDILIHVDWSLNMQIVDEINHCTNRVVIEEAVRVLRKKLLHKHIRVAIFAVTLTETLVKNCSVELHRVIATPKFMNALATLARKHSHRPSSTSSHCAEKVLDLIQSWGEAFLPQRQELPLFVTTYHTLRKEGLPFPQQYKERPPVLNPVGPGSLLDHQSKIEVQIAQANTSGSRRQSLKHAPNETWNEQEEWEGNNKTDLDLPRSFSEKLASASTLSETLTSMIEASDSATAVRRDDIISELLRQGKRTVLPAIINLIEERVEASPSRLQPILDVKDALDSAFELYEQAVSGKISLPVTKEEVVPQQENVHDEKEELSIFDSIMYYEGKQPEAVVVPLSAFKQTERGFGAPVPVIPSYDEGNTRTSGTSKVGPPTPVLLDGNAQMKNPGKKEDSSTTTKVQNLLANLESLYASGSSPAPAALSPSPAPLSQSSNYNSLEPNASSSLGNPFASHGGDGGALSDWSQQHQSHVQALQTPQDQPQTTQVHQLEVRQPQAQLLQQGGQGHPALPQFPQQQQPFQEGYEQQQQQQYTQWPSTNAHNEKTSQTLPLGQGGQFGQQQQQVVSGQQGPLMYSEQQMMMQQHNPQLHQSMSQHQAAPPLYGCPPVQEYAQQAYPEQPVQSVHEQQHVHQPVLQEPIPPQQSGQLRVFETK